MKFPKVEGKYPGYCCQHCGETIGWLGRFIEKCLEQFICVEKKNE